MKKILVAAALLASMTAANAYQYEVNASYENTDIDDLDSDIDTFNISGKYYFAPVATTTAPLAEAAFLSKASNVALAYTRAETDVANVKADLVGISGEYYVPNSQFYVSANVNHTKLKANVPGLGSGDDSGTGYAVEVGFLPVNGLLLAIGATDMEESVDPNLVANFGTASAVGAAFSAGEDTAATLRTKYVTRLANNDVNFESKVIIGDEAAYRFAADLYLDPTLSVGASFAKSTLDDTHSVYGIRAQKFLTPIAAIGLGYTTTDGADSFGINGTFRF